MIHILKKGNMQNNGALKIEYSGEFKH